MSLTKLLLSLHLPCPIPCLDIFALPVTIKLVLAAVKLTTSSCSYPNPESIISSSWATPLAVITVALTTAFNPIGNVSSSWYAYPTWAVAPDDWPVKVAPATKAWPKFNLLIFICSSAAPWFWSDLNVPVAIADVVLATTSVGLNGAILAPEDWDLIVLALKVPTVFFTLICVEFDVSTTPVALVLNWITPSVSYTHLTLPTNREV